MKARVIWTLAVGAMAFAISVQLPAQTRGAAQTGRDETWSARTPWGDPDLQSEWTTEGEYGVPFERLAQFGTRQFLTDAMTGTSVGKEVLQTLHTPVIYIEGGPTDIAYENGMDDFKRISHVPAAMANLPVGHGGTFYESNRGAAASVAVSWLNWQLRGDAQVTRA